jgi:hypothetical protein
MNTKFCYENLKKKRSLGRLRVQERIILKFILKRIVSVGCIHLAQYRVQ